MPLNAGRSRHALFWIWIAAAFALFVIVFGVLYVVFEKRVEAFFFEHFHGQPDIGRNPQDFGNAGAYYSFVIGVPIALLAAIVGVVASGLFATYTTSRDEVTIFSFIEGAIKPASRKIQVLITSFNKFIIHGNKLIDAAKHLVDELTKLEAPTSQEEFDKNLTAALETLPEADKSTLEETYGLIDSELKAWKDTYDDFALDTYGALFVRERIGAVLESPQGSAISYLRKTLPADLHDRLRIGSTLSLQMGDAPPMQRLAPADPGAYANDLRQILDNVIRLLALSDVSDAIRAYVNLPSGMTTIEYLGAVIYSPMLQVETPGRVRPFRKAPEINAYMVNVGAAWLLTLYQYIPEKESIRRAFEKIFEGRSIVAKNFIDLAGPSPRNFIQFQSDDSFSLQLKHFNRLIVVSTPDGEAFYDPKAHGPIPAAGAFREG